MADEDEHSSWVAVLAVVGAVLCYGSYFVPAKKYEIHDGMVYQWYQCSGIMMAGTACALVRNDWTLATRSPGFYVAPEGLLAGVLFQVANILAAVSVKIFGLGNYYTVHQVSNLGVTFFVGVFGPDFGIPAVPPHNVPLAAFGFVFVLLGMLPVMFMEKEFPTAREVSAEAGCAADGDTSLRTAAEEAGRLDAIFLPDPAVPPVAAPVSSLGRARTPSAAASGASTVPDGDLVQFRAPVFSHQQNGAQVGSLPGVPAADFRGYNAQTWDGTLGRPPPREDTRPVPPKTPISSLGHAGLVIKEASRSPEATMNQRLLHSPEQAGMAPWRWVRGFLLSLLAGCFYSGMYVPLLPWKERMKKAGKHVEGYDSFFSMCVGLYLASTAYMLCGGAWRKYQGQRMEKSVLRPALFSGVIYAVACFAYLFVLMVMPYAVGYALVVGGGLAVSLLWSTLVFGEASSRYNRRCVVCSFLGVGSGIVLLGLSA
mmetsp:Transcript_114416/g.356326  ORF Transcript_114416/g.356326 Transcript_114416/m.356326 type:complete len:483 (-) Transcript_114416:128-1576(-)